MKAPRIRDRGAIIWLLTGLNLFNYLDRYIVTAVSPRIQEAFCLSNLQTGAILSAFMLGYFVTSPAFGALGDRMPRKGLIALGVGLWSLATAASGLSAGFLTLLLARVFVGVGEASYATLSPTIIDDLTTTQTKNRWLAVFYVAIPVGSAIGFGLGGFLEHAFGWRSAFYVAGLPGILLAILVMAMEEPARKPRDAKTVEKAFRRLAAIPTYRLAVGGYVAYTFALGGFAAWAPKYVSAELGMKLKSADFWIGVLLAAAGLTGTALGGWLGDRAKGGDRSKAALNVCGWVTALAVPSAVICLLARTPAAFFVFFAITSLLLFTSTAPVNAAILRSVPDELRASAMAVSIFAIHLFGDLVSPPLIGWVADLFGAGKTLAPEPVTSSLGATVPLPCGPETVTTVGALRPALLLLIPAMIALGAALWWWGSRPRALEPQPEAA